VPENDDNQALIEAEDLFDQARQASRQGDYDKAIELYIEGLRRAPDEVAQGHIKLRETAAARQAKGGPKPTEEEKQRYLQAATPLDRMLAAEYLLAKDPVHLPYAEAMLKAAVEGGYRRAAKWIGDLIFLANNHAKKPSFRLYTMLKDAYAKIGRYDRAASACEAAVRLRPNDKELSAELAELVRKRDEARAKRAQEELRLSIEPEEEELDEVEVASGPVAAESIQGPDDAAAARARDLFAKARQVAEANDLDYAIDLYIQGLRHMPDALEEGHLPLCELGLQRQKKGGKKPSMLEKMKHMRGKTALEQMLNAEYLFAKDPSHLPYAGHMLKAAVAGGYNRTAKWIANYLFQENNALAKPSFHTYILLKDCYRELGEYDKALAACQHAARLKPQDSDLAEEMKNLTAEMTMARGRYDQQADFTESIKDRELQEKIYEQERLVKTVDYRKKAVEDARRALAADPEEPSKIFSLAKALCDTEDEQAEQEAIRLLEDAYARKQDFSFARRAGEIKMSRLRRTLREAEGSGSAEAAELRRQLGELELEHFRRCVENYPTDLRAKYDYGVRLMQHGRYDEAIPLLQEAQRDPRNKIAAMDKIGLCFFEKGWYADAADVFTKAIESYRIEDDDTAKELRYNLARSLEEQGKTQDALEIYRKIAQLDFSFKDVRERVDRLRSQKQ